MSFNSSLIFDEILSRDDPLFWNRRTPVNCNTIRIIGIFLCVSALVGIVLNGSLVYSFIRYKSLRTPPNIFIMFISIIGLLASSIILPSTGTSCIYCYWLYGRGGCIFEAVLVFLYGCSSSYLLCAVSLSRCYIIVRPFNAKDVTVGKCLVAACIAVSIVFIYTMLPIIGWNEYTMEEVRTSCCINWYDRRFRYMSFTFFLFIFVYFFPLLILLTTNTIIYFGLKRMRDKISQGVKTELSQKRIEMERRIVKSIIITVCGFIFTWTPYAVVLFVSAFGGKDASVSPMATFICACFAKTSVVWMPILYISTSTHFRLSFVDTNSINKQGGMNTTAGVPSNLSIAAINIEKSPSIPVIIATPEKDFSGINEQ